MKTTIKAGICAAAFSLVCTVAIAQSVSEVVVQAHRGPTSTRVGRDRAGIPIDEITYSLGVSLADLDLSTSAGKSEASRRIFTAAGEVCTDIVHAFPEEARGLQKCTQQTSHQAQLQLNRLMAAAQKPGENR